VSAVPPPPPPPPNQEPPASAPPPPPPAAGATLPTASEPQVIQTDVDAKDGLTKCARCGATDITLNPATGNLRCGFCRFEWQAEEALETHGLDGPIGELRGLVVGSGATTIESTETVLTFKCSACGADVVIDTNHSTHARCHWCRNSLSMNQQIPNGAVPDMILPFSLPKAAAVAKIQEFVRQRQFFAHPRFKAEFAPENVMGVYLPYMVIDINAHASMSGVGEHQLRQYTVKRGDSHETRYDAAVYQVAREFDLHVNDLTVESSSARLDQRASANTNNIINSIMPFDTANSVTYDANYLAGFSMERRDSNIEHLMPLARTQAGDIARYQCNATLQHYDRGVRWDHEQLDVIGQRWVSAYLPVWLYSYYERKNDGTTFLHYVAVNGRTGETMGSVPIHKSKLFAVSAVVQVIGSILGLIILVAGS
jgi:DNA-directed RNA polymerase subunit RPC12/RpoP